MNTDELAARVAIDEHEFSIFLKETSEEDLRETAAALALLDEPVSEKFDLNKIKSIAEFKGVLNRKQRLYLGRFIWASSDFFLRCKQTVNTIQI